MDNQQVNFWISANAGNFAPEVLPAVKRKLEQMDNTQMMYLSSVSFKKPSTIFLIAILLGLERFFLGDTKMAVLKLLTGNGCYIWWLVDIFSAKKRAMVYNFNQFQQATAMVSDSGMHVDAQQSRNVSDFGTENAGQQHDAAPVNNGGNNGESYAAPQNFDVPPVNRPNENDVVSNLYGRLKGLFVNPQSEYRTIAKENPSHTAILTGYVLFVAIIPFLFSLIRGIITFADLFGYSFFTAIWAIFRIILSRLLVLFGGIYLTALLVNSMAEKFGGKSNFNRAFALVAYAYTPMFLAGIFNVWSSLSWLIPTVGVYGLYLLVAGLRPMMQPSNEKADAYSSVSFVIAAAVYAVLWKVVPLIVYGY